MAEQTEGSTEIKAPPAEVMAVLTAFDDYPEWAGIRKVEIRKKDSKGRGSDVYMEVSQMGVEAKYTLSYTYKANDAGVSWTTKEAAGAVKDITGEYQLQAVGDDSTK